MNFWKDPQYAALRVVIVVVLIGGIGYFAFGAARKSSLEQTGRVIETAQQGPAELGPQCDMSVTYESTQTYGAECTVTRDDCTQFHGESAIYTNISTGEETRCCSLDNGLECVAGLNNGSFISLPVLTEQDTPQSVSSPKKKITR